MAIWRSASKQSHAFLSAECLQQLEPYVRTYIEAASIGGFETFVHSVKGQPVAFITLSDGEVLYLYVAPEFQKKGIGGRLLRSVKSKINNLTLTVHSKNPSAIRFYELHGFVADGTVTTDSCNEPQLKMSWQRCASH